MKVGEEADVAICEEMEMHNEEVSQLRRYEWFQSEK